MDVNKLLSVHDGCFGYERGKPVFSGIDLEVHEGEILCILGPNGCGKTTLLDAVLGHHRFDRGSILLDDRDASTLNTRERAKLVSYVPQNHAKSFPYTVEQVVMMGRSPHMPFHTGPGREDLHLVRQAVSALNLEALAAKEYTRLSGGETQLVLIARALAQESRLMVLDEPASHLDFTNELLILETLTRLVTERRIGVIMASHVPNHAFYFANRDVPVRVAMMKDGRFARTGSPAEVLTPEVLDEVYGVEARVLEYLVSGHDKPLNHVVPLGLKGGT